MVELLHGRCCRLTTRDIVVALQQVASGLAVLDFRGIVHQDLHAHNVLQALNGVGYKIIDLGSAACCERNDQPNMLQICL